MAAGERMRICMVVYELLEFGGLEEIVATLAPALRERGQRVSVLCLTSVPSKNQYRLRLVEAGIPLVQFPPWVWRLAPDWAGRERMAAEALARLAPLVYLLACGLWLAGRRPWPRAAESARGWLRGRLWRLLGPDRREALGRLLLGWWRRRWRPDVLHIHGYTSFLPFVLDWAFEQRIPALYEEHQTPDPHFNWWERFKVSINKAPLVAAVSETSGDMLREVCGVVRPIITVAPIVADPAAAGWRPPPGPNGSQPVRVTTIARLEENKGLSYLLEAMALVRQVHPQTEFVVHGDGSLRADLLAQAARLGLAGERILAGPFSRPQLPAIMAATDIFALSSVIEGLPVALIEAMAYGCAIVATSVGGNPDVIEDGVNGLLCPPRDAGRLARCLIALIEDPALRARLGRAARETYMQGRYHPASVCEGFLAAYRLAVQESCALYA